MVRATRLASLLAFPLIAACSTADKPYDPTTYSGGACTDESGVACDWSGVRGIQGYGSAVDKLKGDGEPIGKSWLYLPADLSFGPDKRPYILDWNNHRVRIVRDDGTYATVIGTGQEGDGPPNLDDEAPYPTAPGCDPATVRLNHPTDVKWMPDGTLVLDAWHDNKIRVVDPVTNKLKVLAGGTYGGTGDGGPAWDALFNQEKSIAITPEGRIYTNDQRNERIRMIDIDTNRTITTIAGDGHRGYAGDGGDAKLAEFSWDNGGSPDPSGSLLLKDHQLYIADSGNNKIRVIDLDTNVITCVAGEGCQFPVTLDYPMDLEWGPDGRLYIDERDGNVIDALDLTTGKLEAVVGNGKSCAGQGQGLCIEPTTHTPALEVQLDGPYGFSFDPLGNIYVADTNNGRIIRVAK